MEALSSVVQSIATGLSEAVTGEKTQLRVPSQDEELPAKLGRPASVPALQVHLSPRGAPRMLQNSPRGSPLIRSRIHSPPPTASPTDHRSPRMDMPMLAPAARAPLKKPLTLGLDMKTLDAVSKSPSNSSYGVSEKSERERRRASLAECTFRCDQIENGLFLGGDQAARNKKLLQDKGITHVVNIAAAVCGNYHHDFTYLTLYFEDDARCDIESGLYEAADFIKTAIDGGHKVLVHCYQGVSRSATAVIAYLMIHKGYDYTTAMAHVVACRPIATPNDFFVRQLLDLHNRLRRGPARARLLDMCQHTAYDPNLYLPRCVPNPFAATPAQAFTTLSSSSLLATSVYLLQTANQGPVYVWAGTQACPTAITAAQAYAHRLITHEHAHHMVVEESGRESLEFLQCFEDKGSLLEPSAEGKKSPFTPVVLRHRPSDDATNPPGGRQTNKPEMLRYPDGDPIFLFDSDDLDDDGVFVVFDRSRRTEAGTITAFVWVGKQSPKSLTPRELEDEAKRLLQDTNVQGMIEVVIVRQGMEDDVEGFWGLFASSY